MSVITAVFAGILQCIVILLSVYVWQCLRRHQILPVLAPVAIAAIQSSVLINLLTAPLLPLKIDLIHTQLWTHGLELCTLLKIIDFVANTVHVTVTFVIMLDIIMSTKRHRDLRPRVYGIAGVLFVVLVGVCHTFVAMNANLNHDFQCDYMRAPTALTVVNLGMAVCLCSLFGLTFAYAWPRRSTIDLLESGRSCGLKTPNEGRGTASTMIDNGDNEIALKNRKLSTSRLPELPTRHRKAPLPPVRNAPPQGLDKIQERKSSSDNESISDLENTFPNTVHRRLTLIDPQTLSRMAHSYTRQGHIQLDNNQTSPRSEDCKRPSGHMTVSRSDESLPEIALGQETGNDKNMDVKVNNYTNRHLDPGNSTPRNHTVVTPVSDMTITTIASPAIETILKFVAIFSLVGIIGLVPLACYTWNRAFCGSSCYLDYSVYFGLLVFADVGAACRAIVTATFVKLIA